jgi:hypothetical protein
MRCFGRGYRRVSSFDHFPNTLAHEVLKSNKFRKGFLKFLNFVFILTEYYSKKRDEEPLHLDLLIDNFPVLYMQLFSLELFGEWHNFDGNFPKAKYDQGMFLKHLVFLSSKVPGIGKNYYEYLTTSE